jgi:hypothetical protein
VGVTQLSAESHTQTDLFQSEDKKREKATEAVDQIKRKYGNRVIGRGIITRDP